MNNIEKIDKLLQNELELNNFIDEINKQEVVIPKDLKHKILYKVNKKKKSKYSDICKIAACLILSLCLCRTDFIKNDDMKIYKEEKQTKISINKKLSDFCKWATTPLEKEEEEKK